MKYEYRSVTGKYYIEVDERFNEIMMEMKKKEENAYRRYGRHNPVSLESVNYEGEWFSDGTDILSALVESEAANQVLSCLSERQRYLLTKCYLEGHTFVDLAIQEGVSEDAIRHAVKRAKMRIKNYFL